MSDDWCETVSPEAPVTQGDIVLDCPLLAWGGGAVQFRRGDEGDWLSAATHPIRADVVVMTQACDLEHSKVRNVVLCPHLPISEYRHYWQEAMLLRNQQPVARDRNITEAGAARAA